MLDIIILSQDNPQMLSLTLQSLKKKFSEVKINVLFHGIEKGTPKGYLQLLEHWGEFSEIYWHTTNIGNYKKNLINLLKTLMSKEVLFLTDGDVLFDDFDISEVQKCLLNDEVLCHSLRLGLNTNVCTRMECENVIKAREEDNHIIWDWSKHYLDFGYPFSLHGHIFNTKEITKLIKKAVFNDHFTLEEGLQMFELFPKKHMTAFKYSKSVFIPYNPEFITIDDFLDGYIPDFESMDFTNINKCEGEIHFENIKIAK